MPAKRNILWIMCDQLRFDYLGCYGHPRLATPNIDALAGRGMRFTRAYAQSPICGPSRMSFYTGRYVRSHGSTWNGHPLRVGEPTLGDHLADLGVRNVLVGKTHMRPDTTGMARLGIARDSLIGARAAQCGFEVFERDDGLHPDGPYGGEPAYDDYLRQHGYGGDNPWQDWANSAEADDGEILSGWLLAHADKPARVAPEHAETPYMTRRAMDFIDGARADDRPWCLHLSYIKPHWPYIVPAPYHEMFGPDDVLPAVRDEAERADPHPVFAAFMRDRVSRAFSRDEVRRRVIPTYMGLIRQIDDQVGELMAFLDNRDLAADTMVVFTADHGDYLGDHWLGEKDLFHEPSVKIPLIIADPRPAADATRGTSCDRLVEAIDLAPTFHDWFGGAPRPHIMEGRSLRPLIEGQPVTGWRDVVVSEYDYSHRLARSLLDRPPASCNLVMVFDGRWKYIHAEGFRPMLYDLETDPGELTDLGADPGHAETRARLNAALADWALRQHNRITVADDEIINEESELAANVLIGYWDEAEVARARAEEARKVRKRD